MSYRREIPRDFFNEANLLKCLGQLSLIIHDREYRNIKFVTTSSPSSGFNIHQDADGSLFCSNWILCIDDKLINLYRPLNSREEWPLYAYYDEEEYEVLAGGKLHNDFINLCKKLGVTVE